MTRKPLPKDAAKRIRSHLATQGVTLSQRKALDLVALVEGYNSWQAMQATVPGSPQQPGAPCVYDLVWKDLEHPLMDEMHAIAAEMRDLMKDGFKLAGPDFEFEDESRVALYVERQDSDDACGRNMPMMMLFSMVVDKQTPGRYALKLSAQDPYESSEYLSWTSGPRFGAQAWCGTAEELLERFAEFDARDFVATLKNKAQAEEFLTV